MHLCVTLMLLLLSLRFALVYLGIIIYLHACVCIHSDNTIIPWVLFVLSYFILVYIICLFLFLYLIFILFVHLFVPLFRFCHFVDILFLYCIYIYIYICIYTIWKYTYMYANFPVLSFHLFYLGSITIIVVIIACVHASEMNCMHP